MKNATITFSVLRRSLVLVSLGAGSLLGSCASSNEHEGNSASAQKSEDAQNPSVMLGVRMVAAGPAFAKHRGVDPNNATLITHVAKDTPASKGGMEDWDLVIAINGNDDASPASIRAILDSAKPGDTVTFTVRRGEDKTDLTITLDKPDNKRLRRAAAGM